MIFLVKSLVENLQTDLKETKKKEQVMEEKIKELENRLQEERYSCSI